MIVITLGDILYIALLVVVLRSVFVAGADAWSRRRRGTHDT